MTAPSIARRTAYNAPPVEVALIVTVVINLTADTPRLVLADYYDDDRPELAAALREPGRFVLFKMFDFGPFYLLRFDPAGSLIASIWIEKDVYDRGQDHDR